MKDENADGSYVIPSEVEESFREQRPGARPFDYPQGDSEYFPDNNERRKMARNIIKSDELWATNLPYSYGAIVKGGTLIFLAGAIAVDKQGKTVGKGDMKAQIKKTVENVQIALKAAGATLRDVVHARYYTPDVDAFLKLAPWRCQQFPGLWGTSPGSQEGAPATLVGVTKLGYEGGLVEIEVVAQVP